MNEQQILDTLLPLATTTYVPVAHKDIIGSIKEQLSKRSMTIENSRYLVSHGGNRLIGYYDVSVPNSSEIGLRFGFRNSYDKSMSIAIVTGAQVWICSNGLVKGDGINFVRRHTGNVIEEVNQIIENSGNQLEQQSLDFISISEQMKSIYVSKQEAAGLYGRAFLLNNQNLFNTKQLVKIKQELNDPSYEEFKKETLWSAYNHVTYVLKENKINNYFQQHVKWHKFIEEEYASQLN